jgi:5-methylcytosine-specific restriction endonuclease McrA
MSRDKRVYKDRSTYLKLAVTRRRRALKLKAVEVLGGQCSICGYDKHPGVLDFHHINPATKSFGISSGGFSRSWTTIENELKKCILVCANCHREIELGIIPQD